MENRSKLVAFLIVKIMDALRSFMEEKLWCEIFMDDDEFINWLKGLGLLHRRLW